MSARRAVVASIALAILAGFASRSSAEPVTTIRNSGPAANRVDIVILGDGYTAAEIAANVYATHVNNAVNGWFAQQPYSAYRNYFNVHRIDVASAESGADHPSRGIFKNTAFNSTYDCFGTQRLICADVPLVNAAISRSISDPNAREIVLVLVNDPEYGGSGGSIAVASIDAAVVELVLHEVGHSFGLLADEYGGPPPCGGGEPANPNATRDLASIKWAAWIAPGTPIPTSGPSSGVPGAYEGAVYCDTGFYRPTWNSKMRSLGVPFEQINVEQHVKRIYNWVDPIDASAPVGSAVTVRQRRSADFSVSTPAPLTHALSVTWTLDGVPIATGPSLTLNASQFTLGTHTLSAIVVDPTPWVRNDPAAVLRSTRSWAVTITSGRAPSADFSGDGSDDIAVFRPTAGLVFINGGATTSWGVAGDIPVQADYDGDGDVEFAVWRPSTGQWFIVGQAPVAWGQPGDRPVPADYTGDGAADIAVWRPSTGTWFVMNQGPVAWGQSGDIPVPADYNNDGIDDIAIWRPSTGSWWVRNVITVAWGLPGDVPVPADFDGNGTADIAVFRRATGTWFVRNQFIETWGLPGDLPVPLDRSGDGRAELGVFRPSTGAWYFRNRATGTNEAVNWGAPGDIPLGPFRYPPLPAGDFDGDIRSDMTVFRPSAGTWYSLSSASGSATYTARQFGGAGDIPSGGDYDGDGVSDPAVFRPSNHTWYVLRSSTGYTSYLAQDFGATGDVPVQGDYDGDARIDIAVYRPSLGRWSLLLSASSTIAVVDWGAPGDIPAPADYDGDRRIDPAVFRPSDGRWYVYNRVTGGIAVVEFGSSGDRPVAADFDGDGRADLAVFEPSLGRWRLRLSSTGATVQYDFGVATDVTVAADYDGDGRSDIAVYRPSTGVWFILNRFAGTYTAYGWGAPGDLPATR